MPPKVRIAFFGDPSEKRGKNPSNIREMNSGIRTTLFFTVFRGKHGSTLNENSAGMTQHEREQNINSQIFSSLKGKIRLGLHVEFETLEKINSLMLLIEQTLGKYHEHFPQHFPQNDMNRDF
jgi:hypothetical protein